MKLSARCCTWAEATPSINTDWGMKELRVSEKEKELGVLVDKRLHMNWQHSPAVQKAKHIPGCTKGSVASRLRGWFFPSAPLYWDPTWNTESILRSAAQEGTCPVGVGPEKGHKNDQKDEMPLWRKAESWGCSAWRREGSKTLLRP